MAMDQLKLRTLVFEKTGVKIDVDDPVFALVALNEAVLEDAVERHVAAIDSATRELVQHARETGGLAPPRDLGPGRRHDASHEHEPAAAAAGARGYEPAPAGPVRAIATQAPAITRRELRLLGAAAGIAVLSALLVLGGQAAFSKPGLTPVQTQALHDADQLRQAIDKLDPKLRAEVRAQLQK
jgi:hypothetical protein